MVINSDNATRKNQMMMSFQTGILISVASIHGTNAEKKIMADTLYYTEQETNLVLIAALVTNKDGRTFLRMKSLTLLQVQPDQQLGRYK